MTEITSTKNPIVRRFREAAAGDPPEVCLAEGVRLCAEALAADLPVEEAAVTERVRGSEEGRAVLRLLERNAAQLHWCSPSVMERLSAVKTPPGVLCILRRPALLLPDLFAGDAPLVVIAAGLKDPGNVGAVIRSAEAAGATGVAALRGGADPWREKAVRGSAGSVFRVPTLGGQDPAKVAAACTERGLQVVMADGQGGDDYLSVDFAQPTALVLGAEDSGIPRELSVPGARRIRIPMAKPVESLNVSVAAGILLFEARRQRR